MQKRFIVVDQGYFRDEKLAEIIEQQPEVRFIVTDVALLEMCKSAAWESTIRRSFEILSRCPTRVYAAKSVAECLRYELENRKSIEGQLTYRDFTPAIRSLLREVESGHDGPAFERFHRNVDAARNEVEKEDLNHKKNAETLSSIVNVVRSALEKDFLKSLKNRKVSDEDVADLALRSAPNLIAEYFEMVQFPKNRIARYLASKPMAFRYILLRFWLSLEWAALGGLENLPERKATNELLDQDYVLIASFFDGILSKDARVNKAYTALSRMLKN